jgi:hypothetical protein
MGKEGEKEGKMGIKEERESHKSEEAWGKRGKKKAKWG